MPKMPKNINWKSIFPAICIPLKDDYSVNEPELRRYVSWLADFDEIGGVVTNGHTGEITSMSLEERAQITSIVADEIGSRSMVISGVCSEGTMTAIDEAKAAQAAGADGILLMPPHIWLRFGMNRSMVVNHFRRIAEAIDIGIVIHLYPFATKAFYDVDTIVELARIPNVKCLKIGTRQQAVYERDIRILREKAPKLSIITCHDEYLLTSMYPGVDGALIGFAGCIPELITQAWKALKAGDFAATRKFEEKIAPMSEAIYGVGQPSGEAHARTGATHTI
ncbi:MAG: dihydrodipicolinate synthase family protein [Christensenellales bacterium]|jgi:4-hydroxy-tetrahydrodipicolinate synthase